MMLLANAALPSCMITSPAMLLLLYPIILIEARCIRDYVQPKPANSLGLATKMNLWSTLVGIPAAVLVMWQCPSGFMPKNYEDASLIGKVIFLMGEGMIPGFREDGRAWMFWAGALLIHITYCIVSILVEWPMLCWLLSGTNSRGILKAVITGNVITYALLPLGYIAVAFLMTFMD